MTPPPAQNQSSDPTPTPTPWTAQGQNNDDNQPDRGRPAQTAGDSDGGGISLIVVLLAGLSVAMVGLLVAAGFLALQSRKTS